MENLILLVHLVTALAVIGLILLQQGKGAEMGASFGAGASQTLFGSSGSGNFFSRMTAILATVFFVTSFTLAIIAKQRTGDVDVDDMPPALEEVRSESLQSGSMDDVPVVDEIPASDTASDVPVVDEAEESSDLPEAGESSE